MKLLSKLPGRVFFFSFPNRAWIVGTFKAAMAGLAQLPARTIVSLTSFVDESIVQYSL